MAISPTGNLTARQRKDTGEAINKVSGRNVYASGMRRSAIATNQLQPKGMTSSLNS